VEPMAIVEDITRYADFLEGYNPKDKLKAASSLENGNP
jgi:hypothetical protein